MRVAEAVGLLSETIGQGLGSRGFRDFSELAPGSAVTEWGRFAVFVGLCADELAGDVPALFDPRNPLLELELSEQVFARVVEAMALVGDEVWAAPDTLGWAYQFFNSDDDRRRARYTSDGKPKAPENSTELAVRNQFFTPDYVVEFLVQNGLGAHLAAGFPELAEELQLLAEVPTERIEVDLDEVSVLDPACGSGHFLLGAYDVLEKAWRHAGVGPAEAAPRIVRSLWGIDIDPRTTQIAQAAVIFRARRHCRDGELPAPNVICARALPTGPEIDKFVDSLPTQVGRAVRAIADELVDAPVLGPLLKIEERLDREVRDVFGSGAIEGTISETASAEDAASIEAQVLAALEEIADSVTSTAAQRLFAAEAHDAVRFVEAMTRRYTAVLMNPPFGEPVPETKPYLKAAYPWIPTKDYNLLAAFVGRGLELAEPDIGTCGAITSRAGMFLRTFEAWRREVLLTNRFTVMADLGKEVMEQALVEAAAYSLRRCPPEGSASFIRLVDADDRASALLQTVRRLRSGEADQRIYRVALSEFRLVPGEPIAYWMGDSARRLFEDVASLEEAGLSAKPGLSTGDDFRFVRTFWEVSTDSIGYSIEDTRAGKRWVPFAKGGEYSPYWSDVHLLVDWAHDGSILRASEGSVIRNPQFYFRRGLTWPRRTQKGFNPRVLPRGCIFSDKGSSLFIPGDEEQNLFALLGYLLSRPTQMFMSYLTTFGSWEVGAVRRLPMPPGLLSVEYLGQATHCMASWRAERDRFEETTRRFVAPLGFVGQPSSPFDELRRVDSTVSELLGLNQQDRLNLDEEFGLLPTDYPNEHRSAKPPGVHWLDEELEGAAHDQRRSAQEIDGHRLPGIASSMEFLSYAVGCSFGRWDLRIALNPSVAPPLPGLWDEPPPKAPGELDDAPSDYPIPVALAGLLVDEPGSAADIAGSVGRVLEKLGEAGLSSVDDAIAGLDDFGVDLRHRFFAYHLRQYTKSNRKAPIYWQLQVPSRKWGVWLYAPRLSREMLFAVVRETEQRQRLAERQIAHLQRETESAGGGRTASEVAEELDAEQTLAVELATFRVEAERIANLGWEPDLDDGMVLNAAPLADLFPAWKDAAKYRDELRAGKYEWATAAQYAEKL